MKFKLGLAAIASVLAIACAFATADINTHTVNTTQATHFSVAKEVIASALITPAYADEVAAPAPVAGAPELGSVSDNDFFMYLLKALGGFKGLGGMALAYALVQLLMMFLKTPMAGALMLSKGLPVLGVAYVLSALAALLAQMMSGVSFGVAFLNGNVLALMSVGVNQIYGYIKSKKK